MTSNETRLNSYLEGQGIRPHETDLADLIVQLGGDNPSHIVVPALHINRMQVREIFEKNMPLEELGMDTLSDDPQQLAEAARRYLRQKFFNCEDWNQRRELRGCGNGFGCGGGKRRQRAHVRDAAGGFDHAGWN